VQREVARFQNLGRSGDIPAVFCQPASVRNLKQCHQTASCCFLVLPSSTCGVLRVPHCFVLHPCSLPAEDGLESQHALQLLRTALTYDGSREAKESYSSRYAFDSCKDLCSKLSEQAALELFAFVLHYK
jgi:hypothetical protein